MGRMFGDCGEATATHPLVTAKLNTQHLHQQQAQSGEAEALIQDQGPARTVQQQKVDSDASKHLL